MRRLPELRTDGERLLARYFERVRGWLPGIEWDYEPALEGRRRRPDFRLRLGGWKCMLEVKEFAAPSLREPSDGDAFRRGRHRRIAAKIRSAQRQLREYQEDHACAVVLVSGTTPDTDVDDPAVTVGALLGDATFRFHLGAGGFPPSAATDPPPAAVVTLREFGDGVAVTVLENPCAARRFPSHLFQGAWDSCWAVDEDAGLQRVFAGSAIRAAEAAAAAAA